jgi:HAD superfamily phosphatase
MVLLSEAEPDMGFGSLHGITCVLFDMDGVLVDVSRSYRSAIAQTAERFTGHRVEPSLIQEYKNRGGLNDDWELTAAIIRDAGVTADFGDVVREFQRLYRGNDWDGLITKETTLIGDDVLDVLAGAEIDLGVVTGRPHDEALWALRRFGWIDIFAVVVAREQQADRPKPDGFPIRQALAALANRHRPEHAVYVGDTIDDVRAALDAGVVPIGFIPPYLDARSHRDLLRGHGARFTIDNHDLLPAVVGIAADP